MEDGVGLGKIPPKKNTVMERTYALEIDTDGWES